MSSGLVTQIPNRRASIAAVNLTRANKELSKAIINAVSKQIAPLPVDLVQLIASYIEKHTDQDEAYYNRLLDELIVIYQANIQGKQGRLASFLAILRELNPLVVGNGRLLRWWDKFSPPLLAHVVEEKGFAPDLRLTVLEWLLWDEEEVDSETTHAVSALVAQDILSTWLEKWRLADSQLDIDAKFLENQLHQILIMYGRKRPKVRSVYFISYPANRLAGLSGGGG